MVDLLPLQVNRVVPSGITPSPCVALTEEHKFVLFDLQKRHSLHSGIYSGIT